MMQQRISRSSNCKNATTCADAKLLTKFYCDPPSNPELRRFWAIVKQNHVKTKEDAKKTRKILQKNRLKTILCKTLCIKSKKELEHMNITRQNNDFFTCMFCQLTVFCHETNCISK